MTNSKIQNSKHLNTTETKICKHKQQKQQRNNPTVNITFKVQ